MKIACTVQYDGSSFYGFQTQKGFISVQESLEKALQTYFREPVRVYGSGRTDTGVHSIGQVVHFDLTQDKTLDKEQLGKAVYALNCILPREISIVYADFVPPDFHARYSCLQREYVYRVIRSDFRMALKKDHLWVRKPLNYKAMNEAADILVGEHDFASFTKEIYNKSDEVTIRRIDQIRIENNEPKVYFYYSASGFLHNMIRIITGVLIKTGKGEMKPSDVKDILQAKTRVHAGVTLPPFPLVFLNAKYKDYRTPDHLLVL